MLAMLPVMKLCGEGQYLRSAQGKLDRIVASGRDSFELREVLGEGWKAVCFLPARHNLYGNIYPPTDGMSEELERFEIWLEHALGRKIVSWQDWGDISTSEGDYMKVLTDKGQLENTLNYVPWQEKDILKVKCTRKLDDKILIERWDGKYSFSYQFENIFLLNN